MKYITFSAILAAATGLTACVDPETTRESIHESCGSAVGISPATLVGMRAQSLDGEIERQGFTYTGGYKQGGSSFTTWYNQPAHQCISVETRQGKIANAETLVEGNCQ